MPAERGLSRGAGPDPALADPQADLFFTLVAVMLPAILLLLPAARMVEEAPARRAQELTQALASAGLQLDGTATALFLARPDGIDYGPGGTRHAPVDAVQDDAGLRETLAAARDDGRPALLLIEPGAEETAFLFEGLAAAAGPARLAQVRLERGCGGWRGPAAQACRSRVSPPP